MSVQDHPEVFNERRENPHIIEHKLAIINEICIILTILFSKNK